MGAKCSSTVDAFFTHVLIVMFGANQTLSESDSAAPVTIRVVMLIAQMSNPLHL